MKRRSGLTEQQVGDELMVVDDVADKVHVLNATSAFIWRCLDETTDPAVIEERIRSRFRVSEAQNVRGMVEKALRMFGEKNLLDEA